MHFQKLLKMTRVNVEKWGRNYFLAHSYFFFNKIIPGLTFYFHNIFFDAPRTVNNLQKMYQKRLTAMDVKARVDNIFE